MARAGAQARRGRHHQPHASEGLCRRRSAPETGLILKVHTSNYRIEGFTSEVAPRELAALAREHGVPLVNDLGSGTLVDLARFGLRARADRRRGGRRGRRSRHLLRRQAARRPAGRLHRRPQGADRADQPQPDEARAARRQDPARGARGDAAALSRSRPAGRAAADAAAAGAPASRRSRRWPQRSLPAVRRGRRRPASRVEVVDCASQIGSGALPLETMPSAGPRDPPGAARGGGARLLDSPPRLRALPVPVIGRIEDEALVLDLRCLEDEAAFRRQSRRARSRMRPMRWLDRCAGIAASRTSIGRRPDGRGL